MAKNITKAQAVAALKKIAAKHGIEPFDLEVHTQGDGTQWHASGQPALVKDYGSWSTTTRWAVVWEEGPWDWAPMVMPGDLQPSVFGEAIEAFSLGLYPYPR